MATSTVTHHLRQPARFVARISPFWLAFVLVATLAALISIVRLAAAEDDPAVPLLVTVLGGIAFVALLLLIAKPWLTYVRVVHELDGSLELTTVFGRHAVLGPGDVLDVREQQFIPQPGSTRVRTVDGQRYYFGPFEHKYALVERLQALRA